VSEVRERQRGEVRQEVSRGRRQEGRACGVQAGAGRRRQEAGYMLAIALPYAASDDA